MHTEKREFNSGSLPARQDSVCTIRNFTFASGEQIPALKLAYSTLGAPQYDAEGQICNAVLMLHASTGNRLQWLTGQLGGPLFKEGQVLDATRYFIIVPDLIGHGDSSKPSDGLRAEFPHYRCHDMVKALHLMVTQGLNIQRLHTVLGTSLGAMIAWLWGEIYPHSVERLVPIGAYPLPLSGRNGIFRRMIIEAIRNDPSWHQGNYIQPPTGYLSTAPLLILMAHGVRQLHNLAPNQQAADRYYKKLINLAQQHDANDLLYMLECTQGFDPSLELEKITAKVLAINFEQDEICRSDISATDAALQQLADAQFILVPESATSAGHLSCYQPDTWTGHLEAFLATDSVPLKQNRLQKTLSEALSKWADTQPNTVAIKSKTHQVTYAQLQQFVLRWQSALARLKLPEGCCIGLRFNNEAEYFLCHLALLKLSITQTVIDITEPVEYQHKVAKDLDVDFIIQDTQEIPEGFSCPVVNYTTLNQLHIDKYLPKEYPADSVIVFQGSGTTGSPKTVAMNADQYYCILERGQKVLFVQAQEKFYCLYRVMLTFPRRQALLCTLAGAQIYLSHGNPVELIDFCQKNQIDHLLLNPDHVHSFIIEHINKSALSDAGLCLPHLKTFQVTGSLVKQSLRETIINTITKNIYILYGMDEFGLVSCATPEDISNTQGTVGKIIDGVELFIHKSSSDDKAGEVWLKSESMIENYINGEYANSKSFNEHGWYKPNDLGFISQDGQLVLEGRSDDTIIFCGTNFYPRVIEDELEKHSQVLEAAVFPLELNGQGNIPAAALRVTGSPVPASLLSSFQDMLGWKAPMAIMIVEHFPKSRSGKILKKELPSMWQNAVERRLEGWAVVFN